MELSEDEEQKRTATHRTLKYKKKPQSLTNTPPSVAETKNTVKESGL